MSVFIAVFIFFPFSSAVNKTFQRARTIFEMLVTNLYLILANFLRRYSTLSVHLVIYMGSKYRNTFLLFSPKNSRLLTTTSPHQYRHGTTYINLAINQSHRNFFSSPTSASGLLHCDLHPSPQVDR